MVAVLALLGGVAVVAGLVLWSPEGLDRVAMETRLAETCGGFVEAVR